MKEVNSSNMEQKNIPNASPVLTVPTVSQNVPTVNSTPVINTTPITPTVDFSSLSSLE